MGPGCQVFFDRLPDPAASVPRRVCLAARDAARGGVTSLCGMVLCAPAAGVAGAAVSLHVPEVPALRALSGGRHPGGHRDGEVAAVEALRELEAPEPQPDQWVRGVAAAAEALNLDDPLWGQLVQEVLLTDAAQVGAVDEPLNGVEALSHLHMALPAQELGQRQELGVLGRGSRLNEESPRSDDLGGIYLPAHLNDLSPDGKRAEALHGCPVRSLHEKEGRALRRGVIRREAHPRTRTGVLRREAGGRATRGHTGRSRSGRS